MPIWWLSFEPTNYNNTPMSKYPPCIKLMIILLMLILKVLCSQLSCDISMVCTGLHAIQSENDFQQHQTTLAIVPLKYNNTFSWRDLISSKNWQYYWQQDQAPLGAKGWVVLLPQAQLLTTMVKTIHTIAHGGHK